MKNSRCCFRIRVDGANGFSWYRHLTKEQKRVADYHFSMFAVSRFSYDAGVSVNDVDVVYRSGYVYVVVPCSYYAFAKGLVPSYYYNYMRVFYNPPLDEPTARSIYHSCERYVDGVIRRCSAPISVEVS